MARKITLNQARQSALRGQVHTALTALRILAEAGDASASYSLAELLAFCSDWKGCAFHAGCLLASPSSVYAGNVFYEAIGLMGQAGHHTRDWDQIADLARSAISSIDHTVERNHLRTWYFMLLQSLVNYANHRGTLPYETLRVFGSAPNHTQSELDAAYFEAKANVFEVRPDLRHEQAGLRAHLFALAKSFHQEEEVIRLYLAGEMPDNFDCAVYVARALSSRGDTVRAWEALWSHMNLWWPVDKAQVAPVILLVDDVLCPLMSEERCQAVLNLPRGPEAAYGRKPGTWTQGLRRAGRRA